MQTDIPKRSQKKACAVCAQEFDNQEDVCPLDGTTLTVISEQLVPGTVLAGRYEIIEVVADGGMGKVYKARHKLTNRLLAVKTLLPYAVASGTALKRFQQEAIAVSLLNHPNVLTVFDFFISDDGQPYLVMDYLEGTNLDQLLKTEGKLEVARALRIFIMAAAGLAHAHEHGLIHRDIKPANIMLVNFEGNPDFVKIVDFGIAKLAPGEGGEHTNLTATGDVFGSPQFMSPEQCRAKPLDARSDIYSLGCVIYITLTGKPPFSGQDAIECMYKHANDTPVLMTEACPGLILPEGLQEIVSKAIDKQPECRYQTMNELRQALEQVLNQLGAGNAGTVSTIQASSDKDAQALKQLVREAKARQSDTVAELPPTIALAAQQWEPLEVLKRLPKKASYGLALAAVLVIAVIALQRSNNSSAPPATPLPVATVQSQPNAVNDVATPQASTQISQITPQTPIQTPIQTPVNQVRAVEHPAVSRPSPRPETSAQVYARYLNYGERMFKSGDYAQAQRYFNYAHKLAEDFGQADPRYVDSLEWQGKVAYQQGNYQMANQAFTWVLYARQTRYGSKSAKVAQAQKELSKAQKALGQR